jgi:diadenylate cyclase
VEFLENLWNPIADFFTIGLTSTLKTMDVKDIIDILVLAFIIFFLFRFARKRRALKLVTGLALFLMITFIGDAIELTAMKFVFGDFKQLGVIAILIIFQPELRSALEKIGGTTFIGLQNMNHNDKSSSNADYVIESVSRAAKKLSEDKHGALMVIERSNSLADWKRSGTAMDAVISPDLLRSIFFPKSALHDGAVIINEGKIDTAACVIRVTDRVDIDSSLGTRHRAAIGTTEISDAVIVVVSEETGLISLSIDGNLERGLSCEQLRERLTKILIPESKKGKVKNRGRAKGQTNRK